MSPLQGLADVVGYRSACERSNQARARARIVAIKPEMADLKEQRVVLSFGLRSAASFGMATMWLGLMWLMYRISQADLEAWAQILGLAGMVLALPMALGNAVTGSVHALRAAFMRFDWVAFEEMMEAAGEIKDRPPTP